MSVTTEQIIYDLINNLSPLFDVHVLYNGKDITSNDVEKAIDKKVCPISATKKHEPAPIEPKPLPKPKSFSEFPKVVKVEFKEKIEDTANGVVNSTVTIVHFDDMTNTIVRRNKDDEDNRDTAVAFAILKRLFATSYDPGTGTANCKNLFDIVHNLVKQASYDFKYVGDDMTMKIPPKVVPPKVNKSNGPLRDARGRFVKRT